MKRRTSHLSQQRHWPIAWSKLIEPDMWPSNSPDLNLVDYAVWGGPLMNGLSTSTIHDTSWSKRSSLSGTNCHSSWLSAPLASDVAGLRASSSSKADTLNIKCENWEIARDNKKLVFCCYFLTICCYRYCRVFNCCFYDADISLSSVATHLRFGGIYSDNLATIFFPDSDSERI